MYLAHEWLQRSWVWDPVRQVSVFAPNFGSNQETMLFSYRLTFGADRTRRRNNRKSDSTTHAADKTRRRY